MPSRYTIKTFVENGYYHVYNRGVEKRKIFEDSQDYKVLLNYFKEALLPSPKLDDLKTIFTLQGTSFRGVRRVPKNFHQKVNLIAYFFLPNHFHLLLHQTERENIEGFMRSVFTRYSTFFNKKYQRVGPLFQGIYKAAPIQDDSYLLHLTRYVHQNPSEHNLDIKKAYSSYADYLGLRNTKWIRPEVVLIFFKSQTLPLLKKYNDYRSFVEGYKKDSREILGNLILED